RSAVENFPRPIAATASAGVRSTSGAGTWDIRVGVLTVRIAGEGARLVVFEHRTQVGLRERPLHVYACHEVIELGGESDAIAAMPQSLKGGSDYRLGATAHLFVERFLGREVREPLFGQEIFVDHTAGVGRRTEDVALAAVFELQQPRRLSARLHVLHKI